MKRIAGNLIIVALLIFGSWSFLVLFFSSHAIPTDRFDQIVEGMTEVEVKALIGVPHHIRHDRPGTTAFYYGGFQRLKLCNMEIYFGADERVTGRFHDH